MPHSDRYTAAINAIDAANAADPATLLVNGAPRPKEQTHAEMMTAWVLRLRPDASETLLLAARAHHLRRWMIPRDAFPAGRSAYLRWRRALHHVHAELAAAILERHGYRRAEVERVHALIAKEPLLQQGDDEAQTLEDALSLVFFQTQLESTMPDLDARQQRRVVGRTWRKMSPAAQQALREMELSNDARRALAGILPDFVQARARRLTPMPEPRERYTHGHHPSVVAQHARRRAEVEAWFLLPRLHSGQRLLDVGCGPGTVTGGLARAVAPGLVTGLDAAPDVLATARQHAAETGLDNLEFVEGDVYDLNHPDETFDIVYANQLLQHLSDPVAALREMRRVLRPGGLLAVRDADYATMQPHPKFPEFERWNALYHQVAYANNAEPDAGRKLPSWTRAAGFTEIEIHPNVVLLEDEEARLWGEAWSQRILHSAVATQALEYNLATQTDLNALSIAWQTWSQHPEALFEFIQIALIAAK